MPAQRSSQLSVSAISILRRDRGRNAGVGAANLFPRTPHATPQFPPKVWKYARSPQWSGNGQPRRRPKGAGICAELPGAIGGAGRREGSQQADEERYCLESRMDLLFERETSRSLLCATLRSQLAVVW